MPLSLPPKYAISCLTWATLEQDTARELFRINEPSCSDQTTRYIHGSMPELSQSKGNVELCDPPVEGTDSGYASQEIAAGLSSHTRLAITVTAIN
jgi:hypothetical protein